MDDALCQVLEAPESATERLVPDVDTVLRQASRDGEIRLTYGELTALITDAVRTCEIEPAHAPRPAHSYEGHAWVRRSGWSRPRGWSQ